MQYRKFGKTGLKVSEIGFGGWTVGGAVEVLGGPSGWGNVNREGFIQILKKVEKLRFLKNESTKTMARAAIKFALSNKAVSVVLPGIKTAKQAEENAGTSDGKLLSSDDLERIRQLYENKFYLNERR